MNYEALIERDLDAIPGAASAFLASHGADELWRSVTRFAVLAYAPSQHAKRAVMACRAAHELRDLLGERWPELLVACAVYASQSRQPWSEPPILDPPEPSNGDLVELQAAIAASDRLRGERWLSARLTDAEVAMRDLAEGDALLMLDTAVALLPHLGEKGRFALLRMPLGELTARGSVPVESGSPIFGALVAEVVERRGAPDAVQPLLVALARGSEAREPAADVAGRALPPFSPYPLGRDYATTLLVHAAASRLSATHARQVLEAVHLNLEQGENFAEWSFA